MPITLAGCMGDGEGLLIALAIRMSPALLFGATGVVVGAILLWRSRRLPPAQWPHAEAFEGADRELDAARATYERLLRACATWDWPLASGSLLAEADARMSTAAPLALGVAGRVDAPSSQAIRNSLWAVGEARRRLERAVRARAPGGDRLSLA